MALIRRRKPSDTSKNRSESSKEEEVEDETKTKIAEEAKNSKKKKKKKSKWSCLDTCCWLVGCICTIWWFLLFLYNSMPASFPQYVTEAITGPLQDPPGVKLREEGLRAKHPVVFVPGIVTGGLELWEGHQCAEGLFRKRLWGGTFGEVYKRFRLIFFLVLFIFHNLVVILFDCLELDFFVLFLGIIFID